MLAKGGAIRIFSNAYQYKSTVLSVVELNEAESGGYSFHAPKEVVASSSLLPLSLSLGLIQKYSQLIDKS